MANYGFEVNKMQSSYNAALCRAGKVTGLETTDKIPNGALVVADETTALPTSIYGTVDLNVENFKKFETGDTEAAYILDAAEVPEVTDVNGNTYRVGSIMTNLEYAYDKILRFRKLQPEDRMYIFDGNVTGTAPTVGQFLIPTNDSFLFTASAQAPVSGLGIKVLAILPLTAGLQNLGSKYLCKVTSI